MRLAYAFVRLVSDLHILVGIALSEETGTELPHNNTPWEPPDRIDWSCRSTSARFLIRTFPKAATLDPTLVVLKRLEGVISATPSCLVLYSVHSTVIAVRVQYEVRQPCNQLGLPDQSSARHLKRLVQPALIPTWKGAIEGARNARVPVVWVRNWAGAQNASASIILSS